MDAAKVHSTFGDRGEVSSEMVLMSFRARSDLLISSGYMVIACDS